MLFLEQVRGRPTCPCGRPGARGHYVGDPWSWSFASVLTYGQNCDSPPAINSATTVAIVMKSLYRELSSNQFQTYFYFTVVSQLMLLEVQEGVLFKESRSWKKICFTMNKEPLKLHSTTTQ